MNQKTKTILKSIFILALFIISVQFVFSQNVSGPLNTGPRRQYKMGALAVGTATLPPLYYSGLNIPVKLSVAGAGYLTLPGYLTSFQATQLGTASGDKTTISSLAYANSSNQYYDPNYNPSQRVVCADLHGNLKLCEVAMCGTAGTAGTPLLVAPTTTRCVQGDTPSPLGSPYASGGVLWSWTCTTNTGEMLVCTAPVKIEANIQTTEIEDGDVINTIRFTASVAGGIGNKSYIWSKKLHSSSAWINVGTSSVKDIEFIKSASGVTSWDVKVAVTDAYGHTDEAIESNIQIPQRVHP